MAKFKITSPINTIKHQQLLTTIIFYKKLNGTVNSI